MADWTDLPLEVFNIIISFTDKPYYKAINREIYYYVKQEENGQEWYNKYTEALDNLINQYSHKRGMFQIDKFINYCHNLTYKNAYIYTLKNDIQTKIKYKNKISFFKKKGIKFIKKEGKYAYIKIPKIYENKQIDNFTYDDAYNFLISFWEDILLIKKNYHIIHIHSASMYNKNDNNTLFYKFLCDFFCSYSYCPKIISERYEKIEKKGGELSLDNVKGVVMLMEKMNYYGFHHGFDYKKIIYLSLNK